MLAALAAACSAPGVRPVLGVDPVPASYSFQERDLERFAPEDAPIAPQGATPRELEPRPPVRLPRVEPPPPNTWLIPRGLRSKQLDPSRGPVDLGIPMLLDLGAGHAPYDDGVEPLHADEIGRSGFSGTVIRLSWREPIDDAVTFVGGAAFLRFQDIGLLDGIADARFGFAVLGIQVRL